MKDFFELFLKLIPFIQSYPFPVRLAVGCWVVATAGLAVTMLLVPRTTASRTTASTSSDTWPITGDSQIDAVHKQLNSFAGKSITEAELADILRQLFNRSVFQHIEEERDNASLLFALYRTELLLQHYVSWFRSSPDVRENINKARTRLIKLQQQIAALYGVNFSYSQHGEQYGASRIGYMSHMPSILTQRDQAFITQANQTLQQLQNYLKAAHLWN
jgi:hypothetical protein